jgi:hypothetical protein
MRFPIIALLPFLSYLVGSGSSGASPNPASGPTQTVRNLLTVSVKDGDRRARGREHSTGRRF